MIEALKRDVPYSLALLVALAGSIGSVWLSVGMNLRACPLCFYQRSAAFLALTTLALGLLSTSLLSRGTAAMIALPACLLGLGVALFHVYLEASGTLECPKGVFGLGTAPQQSLALFLLLTPPVLISALRDAGVGVGRAGAALVLGALAALASIKSSPPLPVAPKGGYGDAPFDTCRRVFK